MNRNLLRYLLSRAILCIHIEQLGLRDDGSLSRKDIRHLPIRLLCDSPSDNTYVWIRSPPRLQPLLIRRIHRRGLLLVPILLRRYDDGGSYLIWISHLIHTLLKVTILGLHRSMLCNLPALVVHDYLSRMLLDCWRLSNDNLLGSCVLMIHRWVNARPNGVLRRTRRRTTPLEHMLPRPLRGCTMHNLLLAMLHQPMHVLRNNAASVIALHSSPPLNMLDRSFLTLPISAPKDCHVLAYSSLSQGCGRH